MKFVPPEFNSRRSPVMGRGGIVSTSQPLATAAGLEILAAGGNAADAAVAAAAALNVTEPTSTGIGGDMFALFFDAKTNNVTALNGSGRAPAGLDLERLKREGFLTGDGGPQTVGTSPSSVHGPSSLPPFHPYTITVPGACAGWFDLIEKHGTLPMRRLLVPAIKLAEEGFPVAPNTSYFWRNGANRQLKSALNGIELTIEGRGPDAGEIFHNPGLAKTFRTIAEGGKQAYYEGEIAEAIADVIQKSGGCLTVDDLAAHTSTWDEPASTTYKGYRVHECPPNGQGLTALIALNILEDFELSGLDPLSAQRLHLEIEAMRLAFADTRWYVADPRVVTVPIAELLSKDYAAGRRKLIDLKRATLDFKKGAPVASSDTVYFCVVDSWGNACSFINSNYMGFGTGIVPKGWGFTLQNRGHNFSLDATDPNGLAPRKRPYHTIIPGLITREADGSLFGPFGVMGGFMQPQGHLQVALALIEDDKDPQAALDQLRFCIDAETSGGTVALEDGISPDVIAELKGRGHPIHVLTGFARATFGRGQIILRDPATGVLTAGSDPRADGCAMTLI